MKKRLIYEAPEAEVFSIRQEKNFMGDSITGDSATLQGRASGEDGTAGYHDGFNGQTYRF